MVNHKMSLRLVGHHRPDACMKKKEKRNKNNNSHLFKLELQQADGDEGFGVTSAGVIPHFCSTSPLTSKVLGLSRPLVNLMNKNSWDRAKQR